MDRNVPAVVQDQRCRGCDDCVPGKLKGQFVCRLKTCRKTTEDRGVSQRYAPDPSRDRGCNSGSATLFQKLRGFNVEAPKWAWPRKDTQNTYKLSLNQSHLSLNYLTILNEGINSSFVQYCRALKKSKSKIRQFDFKHRCRRIFWLSEGN